MKGHPDSIASEGAGLKAYPDSVASEGAGLKGRGASEEVGLRVRVRLASPIVRTVKDAEGEPMVLVDSGANMELKPFPKKWKGVPPKEAVRTTICLAMGKGLAWEYNDCLYGKDLEPLMPWGKYAKRCKLSGDLNHDSEHPHIKHVPSGFTVPVVWQGNLPYISQDDLEELRLVGKLAKFDAKAFKDSTLNVGLRVFQYFVEHKTGTIKEYAASNVTEFQLETHRRGGRLNFMPECPECREGAIRQRAHRRRAEGDKPGGELSVDLSGPHVLGRFPTDLAEAWPRRAQYFLIASYRVFTVDEKARQRFDEDFAKEMVSKTAPRSLTAGPFGRRCRGSGVCGSSGGRQG